MNIDPTDPTGPDGPIGDALRSASLNVDVGDAGATLDQVRATARRRGRRRNVLLGLGAVVALAAGGVVVANVVGDDDRGDDFLVSSPATTEPDDTTDETTDEAASTGAGEPADEAPPITDAVEAPVVTEVLPAPSATGDVDWSEFPTQHVVAWNDGFLRFGVRYNPQPLPAELPEDIAELFSQEVRDLFADGLPSTIGEASTMLSEAGLLDEVTQVLSEHPEANDAIYGVPAPDPEFVAEWAPAGGDWEPIEMTAPAGIENVEYAVTSDDRLVVAATDYEYDESSGQSATNAIVLASTTDLVNWTDQRIAPPPIVGTPSYVTTNVWLSGVAADDAGWVAGISRYTSIDLPEVVPDPGLGDEWIFSGGGETPTGVEVYYVNPEQEDEESFTYTWDELGIEPFAGREAGVIASGTWAGGPPRFADGADPGWITAVDGGFVSLAADVDFSPDGLSWTAVEAPAGDPDLVRYPIAVLDVDGGPVVLYGDQDGATTAWQLDTATLTWTDAGLPAVADDLGLTPFGPQASGPATIVMANDLADLTTTVVLENDTYRLEITSGARLWSITLTDLATGDVVVSETTASPWMADDEDAGSATMTPDGGIEVSDPGTGEVLATFTGDELSAAYEAAMDPFAEPEPPELWLLATDGTDWLVERLGADIEATAYEGPVQVVASGGEILVATYDDGTRIPF